MIYGGHLEQIRAGIDEKANATSPYQNCIRAKTKDLQIFFRMRLRTIKLPSGAREAAGRVRG